MAIPANDASDAQVREWCHDTYSSVNSPKHVMKRGAMDIAILLGILMWFMKRYVTHDVREISRLNEQARNAYHGAFICYAEGYEQHPNKIGLRNQLKTSIRRIEATRENSLLDAHLTTFGVISTLLLYAILTSVFFNRLSYNENPANIVKECQPYVAVKAIGGYGTFFLGTVPHFIASYELMKALRYRIAVALSGGSALNIHNFAPVWLSCTPFFAMYAFAFKASSTRLEGWKPVVGLIIIGALIHAGFKCINVFVRVVYNTWSRRWVRAFKKGKKVQTKKKRAHRLAMQLDKVIRTTRGRDLQFYVSVSQVEAVVFRRQHYAQFHLGDVYEGEGADGTTITAMERPILIHVNIQKGTVERS